VNLRTTSLATVAVLVLLPLLATAAVLPERRHILIVGSSTTYPIITAAAERIGRELAMQTPVVESTGTGGGIKFFCSGEGLETPDIVMASRRMKPSERDNCLRNKVFDVREIRLGYDGIVFASNKKAPLFALTQRQLYLALAREVPAPDDSGRLVSNPHGTWKSISDSLPDLPIRVLGPPPTSGTRDALVERVLQPACSRVPALMAIRARSPEEFVTRCHALREDGPYVDSGENDARLVRKLIDDDGALAVLGYNFLDRNRDRLKAATIDDVPATFQTIESGVYPLTRPLYLYVKPRHARLVEGLQGFIDSLLSERISGAEGFLEDKGLIPLERGSAQVTGQVSPPAE
jgi:phosphate transport system substrate-binding protein